MIICIYVGKPNSSDWWDNLPYQNEKRPKFRLTFYEINKKLSNQNCGDEPTLLMSSASKRQDEGMEHVKNGKKQSNFSMNLNNRKKTFIQLRFYVWRNFFNKKIHFVIWIIKGEIIFLPCSLFVLTYFYQVYTQKSVLFFFLRHQRF